MIDFLRTRATVRILAVALWIVSGSRLLGQDPLAVDGQLLEYWAYAKVFSLLPNQELATYRAYSAGGLGPSATLGLGVVDEDRQFDVSIVAKLKARRFIAHVTVKPGREGSPAEGQEVEWDLSDLNPRSLELARNTDGRVYRLSLVPSIVEHPKPKQFNASDLRHEYWSFASSPVILNDQDYVGRLGMSSGPIAWCDIPGVAKIDFSLLHLKDAMAIGTLRDGVINITHDNGTTLRISDVKNGNSKEALAGGPYRVWVRWKKPTQSVEEHRESLRQHIASLKERAEIGDVTLPAGALERLQKMSESGRVGLTESGVRGVEEGDLVGPSSKSVLRTEAGSYE